MLRRFLATLALAVGLGAAGISVAAVASADTVPASAAVSQPAPQSYTASFWW